MALNAGTRLGSYEILAPLGAGGMGEVYRARDNKLGREVAIKVLPEEFTEHPQKLARFEREARLLASLNHPGIATLYGLEKAGSPQPERSAERPDFAKASSGPPKPTPEDSGGGGSGVAEREAVGVGPRGPDRSQPFLVMELVEGQTLADRISQGPIPVTETLTLCQQIAEALEAAHEKGVIHRDLKPANIKVDPEGHVKVLDFGLAKAFADEVPESELSQSPTLSRDATRAGVILGTAAYMSPEQAKGKAVDKRSDIFSFGAVLYEMLTGKKAFGGEDVSDVLASIIKLDIDWKALPSDLDPRIQKLLSRCLKQDRKKRLRDVGDVRNEIEEILAQPAALTAREPLAVSAPRREKIVWGVVGAVLASIVVLSTMRPEEPAPHHTTRFPLTLPAGDNFTNTGRRVVALSPDGTRLVYVANSQLYLREMNQLEAAPIRGTDMAPRTPFFSPDGQWVGFWAGGSLRKVSVTGGAPVTLCEAVTPFGANWEPDDTIVFGQGAEGILRVSANGGAPEVLIPMDSEKNERAHGPQMLPDGKTVLFSVTTTGNWDESQIVAQSVETGERRVLIEGGSDARYVPTGHLIYALGDTLLGVAFDIEGLRLTGGPVPLAEGVSRAGNATGAAHASFSHSGSLAYVADNTTSIRRNLVWVDREGKEEALAAEPRTYTYVRISPDGSQVALDVRDQDNDIWIWDFARETLRRLTFDPDNDYYPVWTPDGQRVAFGSTRDGPADLFWKAADGTGTVERLSERELRQFPYAFSPDGKQLVFREDEVQGSGAFDLHVFQQDGDPSVATLLATEFSEMNAEISPDGRWMAYQSDASSQYEIYVRPFPNVDEAQWQISTGGGTEPLWARDGSELFYLDRDRRLMAVSVRSDVGLSFDFGNPGVVLEESSLSQSGAPGRTYDVSLDGNRFLMIRAAMRSEDTTALPTIVVVENWFEELKRLVPTN